MLEVDGRDRLVDTCVDAEAMKDASGITWVLADVAADDPTGDGIAGGGWYGRS